MLLEKIANELRGSIPGGKAKVDALATKVAGTYLNTGENMTKQIQKLAEAEGLSDEYVKRVCETSNHKVSSHLFNTNEDKNFQFDLADWQQILSPQEEKTASVYDLPPTNYKTASIKVASEEVIEATPYYMKSDPTENLLDLKDTFSRAEEDTRVKLAYVQNEEQFVFQQLYGEFSSEVKDNGYFKVAQALVPFLHPETIESLTYEGISDNTISEDDLFTVEKLAEVVDETAEVIKLGQYYEKLRQEKELYKLAHEEITEQLQTICNTLKAR